MCNICRQTPCPSMCPNADEPRAVYICSNCGETIREGEDYLSFMGEQVCMYCVEELTYEAEYIED
ncbi:MAG: hypothetical protein IKY90_08625 [Oscillospiraceae bacterium]|nr:hypothetical protein [Oscillospiraceae bacterium]